MSWNPETGERLIGDAAKNQATLYPSTTVYDAKRLLGRQFSETDVQEDISYFSFTVSSSTDNKPNIDLTIKGQRKSYSPEEISAMVLGKMKAISESFLGEPVKQAVVTVPAYFNDAQRASTKAAGSISGLNVLRIINEPTAAAIAFGLDKKSKGQDSTESIVMVFDLGGGTFDVTLLEVDQGVFMVMSTGGNTHLGGEDFDHRMMEHFIKIFQRKTGLSLKEDNRALQKLRKECERAKRALSTETKAVLEVESIMNGEDFSESITRAKFEQINADLFQKTLEPVEKVLADAEVQRSEVSEVVLVGGSTRIPKVRQLIKDFFHGKEPHTGLNPDEAVAHGAAIQAGILAGDAQDEVKDLLLMDVTPLSLGTEVHGGRMDILIPRNTVIPKRVTKEYFTVMDMQSHVEITIYEGEREVAQYNNLLGKFRLDLVSAPAGYGFSMTFQLDENGMLTVIGADPQTGKSEKVTVQAAGRLSEEDIARMTEEAEQHAEEDKEFNKRTEAKMKLQGYVAGLKRLCDDEKSADKIDEVSLSSLRDAVAEAEAWLASDDAKHASGEEIERQQQALSSVAEPILSTLKQNSGGAGAGEDENDEDEHDEL